MTGSSETGAAVAASLGASAAFGLPSVAFGLPSVAFGLRPRFLGAGAGAGAGAGVGVGVTVRNSFVVS